MKLEVTYMLDDVAKITLMSLQKKYENGFYNVFGDKNVIVKRFIKYDNKGICSPDLKICYAKVDKKKYNYKVNPFTYKLRLGKILKLNNYISQLDAGLKKFIL